MRLIREAIDGDRYFMSPRVRRLKNILAKVEPASVRHVSAPYPPPKPPGEPSLLYRKLRGEWRR